MSFVTLTLTFCVHGRANVQSRLSECCGDDEALMTSKYMIITQPAGVLLLHTRARTHIHTSQFLQQAPIFSTPFPFTLTHHPTQFSAYTCCLPPPHQVFLSLYLSLSLFLSPFLQHWTFRPILQNVVPLRYLSKYYLPLSTSRS